MFNNWKSLRWQCHISLHTDYGTYCQHSCLNVTLKIYTFAYKINVILSSWPRCQVTKNKRIPMYGHKSKDSQTLFSKLHKMSLNRSYITVRSHSNITVCSQSRTWWVNHACPQHNKRNSCQMLRCRTTVLEQHGYHVLAAVEEGTNIPFKRTWLLKRVIFCQYLLWNIFCAYYCHAYIQLYICLT